MTNNKAIISFFFLVVFMMIMQSCAPTKYVGEDEYLLHRYRIEDEKSDIPKNEYRTFVKQKPNKKFVGWKFWLSIYNLSGKDSTTGLNRWLKEIGEPPVIYSEDLKANTVQQLEMFLFNKGYFDANVGDTTLINKKKANIIYRIEPGKPHYIGDIEYFFEDANLSQYIMDDSASFILKKGQKYDVDNFRAENLRIEDLLRNKGYYNFKRDYIYYHVDSATGSREVNVTMGIRNYPERDRLGNLISTQHPTYNVDKVYMKTVSDAVGIAGSSEGRRMDTTRYGKVILISDPDVKMRHELVTQKNYIIPGDMYNQRKVQQTYRNLTALSVFRLVDINFTEVEGQKNLLDCEIQMLPSIKQAFSGGIEGTTSGGNIGAAGNLNYQHRNLFGGSERFDLTFLGAIETLPENPDKPAEEFGTMQELGVEASLKLPQFLLPFRTDQFIRKFNPETNFNLSYNYQKRPDYTRTTFRGSFGYQWRGNRFVTHSVYPVEISLINTPALDAEFREWLEGTYLYYSYLPHFITSQRYRLVYTNQRINKTTDFQYVRFGFETAGNLMYGLYRLVGKPVNDAVFQLFGVDYAQYVRTGIDLRHYDYIGESSSLVYRFFTGMAVPYLNSSAIPFEKQYFGGGANSIRAWRVKNLGPGSFEGDTISKYPNQTADLKIEVNIEYRFDLFWKIEGAMFLDAGNIWSLSPEDDRQGALFDVNKFYKEFAVGTGFGLRFDFNFFIFRFDLGIPLFDPSYPQGNRWVYPQTDLKWNDFGYNFAIGYPF